MKRSGEQIKQIENALLDGFDEAGLERLVRLDLDERLDRIAGGGNLTEIVHNLVAWAERSGRIPDLIEAACASNPQNESLKALQAASTTWQAESDPTGPSTVGGRRLRWRWPLLGTVVLLAAAATALIIWRTSQPLCGDNPLCVLVAEFSAQDRQTARALVDEIRAEVAEEFGDDVAEGAVIRTAPHVEDEHAAKALASEEDALLLVWGSITELGGNRVRVRFELADLLGVGESTALQTFRAEPVKYDAVSGQVECTDCFDVSLGELGQRIDIVAHAAAGFLHYGERPELAYHEFLQAMHCAGEAIDPDLLMLLDPQCEVTRQIADWNPELLTYYAGKSAARSGDYAAAVELLTRAAQENPFDPAAMLGIAAAYQAWIGVDDAPEVLEALDEAERRIHDLIAQVSDNEDLAALYHDLGLVRELAGDWDRAADEYGKAADLFGEDASAYVSLVQQGHAQRQAGDFAGAETTLLRAAELVGDAPWAYLELAQAAWQGQEDQAEALTWLQQAEAVAPDAAAVQVQHAQLCAAWGDHRCAEDAFQRALSVREGSGWLHMRAGDFFRPADPVLGYQRWDLANEQYRRARDYRSRNDPWLHERLGYVALNSDQYAAAIEHYEAAIAVTYDDTAPARLFCALAASHDQMQSDEAAAQAQAQCEQRTGSGDDSVSGSSEEQPHLAH